MGLQAKGRVKKLSDDPDGQARAHNRMQVMDQISRMGQGSMTSAVSLA